MRRVVPVAAVVALTVAACSSAGDDASGPAAIADSYPAASFCADWDRFDQLTNSDDDPTEVLVQEVLALQDDLDAAVPDGLDSEWSAILDWNRPFIEYFQTAGYRQPSERTMIDLLGGEEAAQQAIAERQRAYDVFRTWSEQNCEMSDAGASFCALWPGYDAFVESDREPTEELVEQLLGMQDEIDPVLPAELAAAWSGIVDWNQAFIDVFETVGYGPITEETFLWAFGGDEEAAGAAEEAMEEGFGTIRSWTVSNCSDGSEYAIVFCTEWAELAALTADEDLMTRESYEQALTVIDRVGTEVPAEVRADWSAVVASARGFHDVLVSVNFKPERITDGLLEQAFGSVDAAVAVEEAADAGRAAIDQWSLTGCGDFCTRWPDVRQALDMTGQPDLGWIEGHPEGPERGHEQLAQHLQVLEIGDQLVPEEIRGPWTLAVAARRDWVAWWDTFDFNGDQLQILQFPDETSAARELADEMMRKAGYLVDDRHAELTIPEVHRRTIEAWQDGLTEAPTWLHTANELGEHERDKIAAWFDGSGEPPEWLLEYWQVGPIERVGYQLTAAVDGWANQNCEAATGRPGTLSALLPKVEGAAGDTLVLAVMEEGATVEDLVDPAGIIAGSCQDIGSDPWGIWQNESGEEERWQSEPLRAERWRADGLCDYRWEEGPARLDADAYTMIAAIYEGRPTADLAGVPTACAALDIRVDGDTVVDVPDLPHCTVELDRPDDAWRNPPLIDPSTPGAGTLQVVFPDLAGDGQGGEVLVVVLPAGTTLNDVGREEVWPVAATRTWTIDPNTVEQGGLAGREVAIPAAELPASGSPRALGPDWLAQGPPTGRLPLAVLAPGTYDVHVQMIVHDPPEMDETASVNNDRCVRFEVTIAGDTVVDLPELGECPRVA